VTVNNVAPEFEAGADVVLEPSDAGVFSRTGISFTDPGADVWSGTVNWGDSPADEPLLIDQVNKRFDLNHTYNAKGIYTVTVTVQDDDGGLHADSFFVDVPNTPPVADDQAVTTDEDAAKPITLTASDADGDDLSFSIVSDPDYGTLSGLDEETGAVTYTPDADYHGSDSFTFKVNDGTEDSNVATVTLTVDPVADIVADEVETNEDTPVSVGVLSNDDFEDPGAYVSGVTQGSNGSVVIETDGTVTYTPDADFNGTDSFTYTVTTHLAGPTNNETATVSVTVLSPEEQVEAITDEVLLWLDEGLINNGQSNALESKLEGAIAKLDEGNATAAVNKLEAFINQVRALVQSEQVPADEGDALIAVAQAAIYSIETEAEEATDAAFAELGASGPLLDPLDDSLLESLA